MFCYIHIPFCESRCKYCRFSTFVEKDEIKKQFYVDYLIKNINDFNSQLISPNIKNELNPLKSIYFWGWTPTSLSNFQLAKIIDSLKNKFSFLNNIEITLETTPNNISFQNIENWSKMWINRLSLWIQSLNEKALSEIWRIDKKWILDKLDIIENYFATNKTIISISLDFIIWLPFVKKWETKDDINYILSNYTFVKHISLYMLEDYYDYPKKWQELSIKDEDFLWEYINCKKYLNKKWFAKYELSNFAKLDFECKHNQAYWNHSKICAFWLSAHWYLDKYRYWYKNDFKAYYKWDFEYIEKLSENDIFLEKSMFWLRTSWLEENIYKNFDKQKLIELREKKLLKFIDNKLLVTDKWVILLDYVLKELIN